MLVGQRIAKLFSKMYSELKVEAYAQQVQQTTVTSPTTLKPAGGGAYMLAAVASELCGVCSIFGLLHLINVAGYSFRRAEEEKVNQAG